jgi:hypothetical protein
MEFSLVLVYLLGYNAVWSVESLPTFGVMHIASLLASLLLGLFFNLEDGGDRPEK